MIFLNSASSAAALVFYLPFSGQSMNRERSESGIYLEISKKHPVANPTLSEHYWYINMPYDECITQLCQYWPLSLYFYLSLFLSHVHTHTHTHTHIHTHTNLLMFFSNLNLFLLFLFPKLFTGLLSSPISYMCRASLLLPTTDSIVAVFWSTN